jgi:hypothetical protein
MGLDSISMILAFTLFLHGEKKRVNKRAERNKILNVEQFWCCDYVDWIVGYRVTQRDYIPHIPEKLQLVLCSWSSMNTIVII